MEDLIDSVYRDYFPDQLRTHLVSQTLADASVDYKCPEIIDLDRVRSTKLQFRTKPADVRIPARLASPLIPYPAELRHFVNSNCIGDRDRFHGHHVSQLETLEKTVRSLIEEGRLPPGPNRYGIDDLKRFARQRYSRREKLISHSAEAFAARATRHDLSIAAGLEIPFEVASAPSSAYLPFVIMIQRLRVHIAKEHNFPDIRPELLIPAPDEAQYTMFSNGTYVYRSDCAAHKFAIVACGGHFRMYHEALGYWFCGPITYLDYVFTIADILNNIDALRACQDYGWAVPTFDIMTKFAEHEGYHDDQVDFMKGLEGFLLNMSDYDTAHAMNWKPILETTRDLWMLDQRISGCKYDYGLVIALLDKALVYYPPESFFCQIIVRASRLTRTQQQEISALHKLIFYAEVNAEAGLKKFLKRVHTPRKVDPIAVKNITRLAKQLFLIAYRKKHNVLPQLVAPQSYVKALEAYTRQGEYTKVEALPLTWWDDVKIFDCMDNTLTDDPLEFAKDKGALKSEISFGPGDSRKELLQVIERPSYVLGDFFADRNIVPLPRRVVRTCQMSVPERMENPARLIEKEREQKWEARLFANGALENKHALSLVTARMKKALSYFDEQLMTPTDRKRKSLIHEASRELSHPDNYSLLLDIEGHNQSMQHSNTAELMEFLGNLFGYNGWGDLPHYFSQLTVYHYDEYMDTAIVSQGQFGGIEGWINPGWTLHTTLTMKLARIMTDLTIPRIMVYSDDVDAIVSIPQASEPMVQSVFQKIMAHCQKFGMTVKYSQTTLSKHRITMLRQHYADGIRADSTLKRLLAISAGNNPVLVADELEVAGICSSAASAMELSNHSEACAYLKNYKLGLLLSRLPQTVLQNPRDNSMLSPTELPQKLATVLYNVKENIRGMPDLDSREIIEAYKNDLTAYLGRNMSGMGSGVLEDAAQSVYGMSLSCERSIDSPDRVLYLQVYDSFMQDLLFYWAYLPTELGGLGASLHVNLMLSGHSIGFTKSLHYLFQWITSYADEGEYFLKYLSVNLSVDTTHERNMLESRLATSTWPGEGTITSVTSSVQQAIKHLVRVRTVNTDVRKLFELADSRESLAVEMVNIFRENFHTRVVQFYHENTSLHFVDLLLNKVETSSGLLGKVRNLMKLRNSLSSRVIDNLRNSARLGRTEFIHLNRKSDIVEDLQERKMLMFPNIKFIEVEEILYDDKIHEVERGMALVTVRRCSPTHYRDGRRVYDDPRVGNETLYKGELLDDSRMLGHKEELLAAKLVAVTKWFLTKAGCISSLGATLASTDIVVACNLALSTLTEQSFGDLVGYAPTETGGEILHRIPNIRFSTSTYIRSEMNLSLTYTTDLNQQLMTLNNLVDSNINVDYLRMRFLLAVMIRDKYPSLRRLVVRYGFSNLVGVKDVQFVKPKSIQYIPKSGFPCYGSLRSHTLSTQRFRHLAHSYMYEENMSEWATMPNQRERQTMGFVGSAFIDDIILRYARELDKDYMLVHPEVIDRAVWEPLIVKLDILDKNWKNNVHEDPIIALRRRLLNAMSERGRLTLLNPQDKVMLELQKQALECLEELRPADSGFGDLTKHFSRAKRSPRTEGQLNIRLMKYQNALLDFSEHKLGLAIHLLAEYILTFHFKADRTNGDVSFSVKKALAEFLEARMEGMSMMIAVPELQFQLLVLGRDYVDAVVVEQLDAIKDLLQDIAESISLADIMAPVNLPSLPNYTLLTGSEPVPPQLEEIEYLMSPIPLSAMATMSEALPLCKFAHRCSTSGAHPATFTSFTGSDSLGAQIGLIRALLHHGWIDEDTTVCDLTAGRGDGKYAFQHYDIDCTSYSRRDTFTRLNHHPDVVFKDDYDIFDGGTLKFINQYDHIHVDVSFAGSSERNLLDLVLMLQENNLQYTIRMNSVVLDGYTAAVVGMLPHYEHYLAYAMNATLKPYQIYLCGRPSTTAANWDGPKLHKTMAFRAMTLSFAKLLSPKNYDARLLEYEPNSVSIQLPKGQELDNLLSRLSENAVREEQRYYLSRYIQEVGPEAHISIVMEFTAPKTKSLIEAHSRLFKDIQGMPYGNIGTADVGNVSAKSRPHQERHALALSSNSFPSKRIFILDCSAEILEHFRIHHPIGEVRTWCNIGLGVMRFCYQEFQNGYDAVEALYREVTGSTDGTTSVHQREIFTALRLLLISAGRDDFSYGIDFCRGLISKDIARTRSLHRTLRIYRLASYLYPTMQHMLGRGNITRQSLEAVTNNVIVREKARYRYARAPVEVPHISFDPELVEKILGGDLDELFNGLEQYAQTQVDTHVPPADAPPLEDLLATSGLTFDLGIEAHIDAAIIRLGLKVSGPNNTIEWDESDIEEWDGDED